MPTLDVIAWDVEPADLEAWRRRARQESLGGFMVRCEDCRDGHQCAPCRVINVEYAYLHFGSRPEIGKMTDAEADSLRRSIPS